MARAKSNSLDLQLQRLAELANAPDSESLRVELHRLLQDASHLIVAKAAEIIGEKELSDFTNDLLAAWKPLIEEPEQDRGCVAKTAILDALARFGFDDPDFCLAGMKYVQIDPGFPSSDSGINVRGGCAAILARSWRIDMNDKLIAMTELLADAERAARVHAVNALTDVGHESVVPLLRVKAQCGDREPEVTGACFSALLRLAADNSVPFVARFLNSSNEKVAFEAAAALGESGHPEAAQRLIAAWKRAVRREDQETLLVTLGLSRHASAVEFLISLLNPVTHNSEPALRALAPSRFYPDIRDRVATAVKVTRNKRLQAIFDELFGTNPSGR